MKKVSDFPSELKHAHIVPIHKKKDNSNKSNYRTVSILSNYSEVHEKLIYNLSQCGFRKGCSAQHCSLVLIEKFKEAIDTGNKFRALLNDLSKVFDCLDHSLLVAKQQNYFSNPTYRIKIK